MELLTGLFEKISWRMDIIEQYKATHFILMALIFGGSFVLGYIFNRLKFNKKNILLALGIFLALLEVFKQLFLTYTRGWDYSWSDFPFQLCSMPIYLCLLYPLFKDRGRRIIEYFLMTYNFLGAVAAVIVPDSLFVDYVLLTVHSVLWHALLVFIGIYLLINHWRKISSPLKFIPVAGLYLSLAGVAVILNAVFNNISNGTINMFFIGPTYPCMIILDDIYENVGWIASTLSMMAATTVAAFLIFLPCCRNKRLHTASEPKNPLIKSLFQNNKFNLFMSVLGTTVLSVAILCVPQFTQRLVDYLAGVSDIGVQKLVLMAAGVLFMVIFSGVCTYHFRTVFSARAVAQYRQFSCDYLSQKKVSDFYAQKTGMYMSAMTNDILRIKENFLDQLPIISQIIICGVGAVIVMLRYNVLLTIASCVISMIPFCTAIIAGRKMPGAEKHLSEKNAEYLSFLKDFSVGFTIIKSYRVESVFSRLHREHCAEVEKAMLRREKLTEKVNYFAAVSGYITRFSVLLVCALAAKKYGLITVGAVIAFSQLISYIIDPVTELPAMLANAKASCEAADKFWEKIKDDVNDESPNDIKELLFDGGVRLCNINYRYSDDSQALRNVSFSIRPGEKAAIIGASGSGKSTILKLIMGILKPESGAVYFGDNDISEADESEIFRQAAYIQQEVFIFDGSLYDNITLFKEYEEEEIAHAIEKSGLKQLLDEKGMDYNCGENGAALSGGEKQRISIARSLLRRTKLLVADEITAALDTETAYRVMDSLISIEGITEVMVLHDLDARVLERLDKIIVLKDVRIVEQGSFCELTQKNGFFIEQ